MTYVISALSPGIPASAIFGLRYHLRALPCQGLEQLPLLEVPIRACPGVMRTGMDGSGLGVEQRPPVALATRTPDASAKPAKQPVPCHWPPHVKGGGIDPRSCERTLPGSGAWRRHAPSIASA